jgi:hypothetical protein
LVQRKGTFASIIQAAAYISNTGQFFGPILAVGAAW